MADPTDGERPKGHYWVRWACSQNWDVLFWRDGKFWDHHDCGFPADAFKIGPRIFPPGFQ